MDHTSQSTHWSRAADMIQQEANDAKRALAKAEARIAELEGVLQRIAREGYGLDMNDDDATAAAYWADRTQSLRRMARQALATKPQEAEAGITYDEFVIKKPDADGKCPHCGGIGCPACDARHLPEEDKP